MQEFNYHISTFFYIERYFLLFKSPWRVSSIYVDKTTNVYTKTVFITRYVFLSLITDNMHVFIKDIFLLIIELKKLSQAIAL